LAHTDCGSGLCEFSTGECVECRSAPDCGEDYECRRGHCVALPICGNSLDCPVGQVCVAGLCAQCGVNADCPDGDVCFDTKCHASCDSDNDCTPLGQLCDLTRGACFRCLQDTDCPETQFCAANGECFQDVCTPARTYCEGPLLYECVANGSGSVQQACLSTQACATVGGQATCQDYLCAPDSVGCVDAQSSYRCAADGFSYADVTLCGSSDVCSAGECLPRVCGEEGALLCGSDAVLRCTNGGTATVVQEACDWYEECSEGACVTVSGPSGNLIGDGDFSGGGAGWVALDRTGTDELPFSTTSGALCVTLTTSELVINVGWPASSAQAFVLPTSVYQFSFDAWAGEAAVVDVAAKVGRAVSPFTAHIEEVETLSDTATHHSYSFTPTHSYASGINFQFQVSSSDAPVQACIDNVVLETTFE